MRIAIPYEDGHIFQHFGHTARFKLYDAEDGVIAASVVVSALGSGHGALAGFLRQCRVDAVVCGGIGAGAQNALADAGITLYGGVQGACDEAAEALAQGRLVSHPAACCDHHSHEHHTCGDHICGEHTCGEHICGGPHRDGHAHHS